MNSDLRISQLELERNLEKMKIDNLKLELKNPGVPAFRREEIQRELGDHQQKFQKLTDEWNTLRGDAAKDKK